MCLAGRAGTNQLVGAGVELRVCDGVGGAAPRVSHMHCRQCWRARNLGTNVTAPWAHMYECFTKFRNAMWWHLSLDPSVNDRVYFI